MKKPRERFLPIDDDRFNGRAEFDSLLERMQTPIAKKSMAAAFDAPSEQLGEAALEAAKRKGD
jgi:hypothetical protein